MLLEFSIANFWSFKEIQTLQMQSSKTKSRFVRVNNDNTFAIDKELSLLKTKAIYGANASGKSNLVKAFQAMHSIIKDCLVDEAVLPKSIVPFLFDKDTVSEPSYFQAIFMIGKTIYRYGFEVTDGAVVSEWLFGKEINVSSSKERYYFKREGLEIKINNSTFTEGKKLVARNEKDTPLYKSTSLFLSVVAAWNGKIAKDIIQFFNSNLVLNGLDDFLNFDDAINSLEEEKFKIKVTNLLNAIDSSIQGIRRVQLKHKQLIDVRLDRKIGNNPEPISLSLLKQAAEGTKKMFALSPYLFKALETGGIIFIDEFDARMHPNLTRKIVELFHASDTNPNNAQLIYVTHDTNLLDAKLLRRDQISFAKKGKDGATELYSLAEFKGIRNDASFEKDYLMGKYDAVPTNLNMVAEAAQPYVTNAKKDKNS